MKLLKRLREWLVGPRDQKLSPEDEAAIHRAKRRLTKYPKLKGSPNPQAHRTAHFKYRYELSH
jgi:hypothetical protein